MPGPALATAHPLAPLNDTRECPYDAVNLVLRCDPCCRCIYPTRSSNALLYAQTLTQTLRDVQLHACNPKFREPTTQRSWRSSCVNLVGLTIAYLTALLAGGRPCWFATRACGPERRTPALFVFELETTRHSELGTFRLARLQDMPIHDMGSSASRPKTK